MARTITKSKMIFHIANRSDWMATQERGSYRVPSLESEGFIHCSSEDQVLAVANAFYPGQSGLVLLVIDVQLLQSEIKWEAPAESAVHPIPASNKFPHVYGPINLEAVVQTLDFEPDANGRFSLTLPHEG